MNILTKLREKYDSRLKELVAEGVAIKDGASLIPGEVSENWVTGRMRQRPATYRVDTARLSKWKTNCLSLLDAIVPGNHLHRTTIETFRKHVNGYKDLDWALGVLRGIGDDFEQNLLRASIAEIEYEVSCEYLEEAKALSSAEGVSDSNITTAAVLTGIALERRLRKLWVEHHATTGGATDAPKRLMLIIDALRKANAINETKAKQLRAWADIRNHAAHGNPEQFNANDLQHMIDGVKSFLTEQHS